MITKFELSQQLESFCDSDKQICITSDGFIIADDGENINYIKKGCLQKIRILNQDNEEVTCFVANSSDYNVILAYKNLTLMQIDRSDANIKSKQWPSRHSAPITAMSLNKSSTRLTTGSADKQIRIWHLGSKKGTVFECHHHQSKITIVTNHPTYNVVVSVALMDHEIVAWDTENGKKLGLYKGHQNTVTSIDFHGDHMISSSRDETVSVWDVNLYTRLISIIVDEPLESVAVLTGGFVNQPTEDDYLIVTGGCTGIIKSISPYRRRVIQEFKKSSLFCNETQSEIDIDDKSRSIRSVIATPDGLIVTRGSDSIEFYSRQMQLQYELCGTLGDIRQTAMIGEHRKLLLSIESESSMMRMFSCQSFFQGANDKESEEDQTKTRWWPCRSVGGGHSKSITSISVMETGARVATAGKDGAVCVWRLESDKSVTADSMSADQLIFESSLVVEGELVNCVCADRSGQSNFVYVYYSVADNVTVLSLNEKNRLEKVCGQQAPHSKPVLCMGAAPVFGMFASGSRDRSVKIWALDKSTQRLECRGVLNGHRGHILSIEFSLVEQVVLTASRDKTIRLWSIKDFSCVSTFFSEHIQYQAVFYKNEKQIISCNDKGFVSVWDKTNGVLVDNFVNYEDPIYCITQLTDGDNKSRGFAIGGTHSLLCLYEDTSEKHRVELEVEKNIELEQKQNLDNLLLNRQFSEAIKFSIRLNRPKLSLEIWKKILLANPESMRQHFPSIINEVMTSLELDDVATFASFAVKWMSDFDSAMFALLVLNWVTTTLPTEKVHDCLSYKDAHYVKIMNERMMKTAEKLEEDLAIAKFMDEITNHFGSSDYVNGANDNQMDID